MKKQLFFLAVAMLAGWAPQAVSAQTTGGTTSGGSASEQTGTATGTIVDENGDPMVGVSVTVKGLKGGQTTDIDGKFHIAARKGQELQFSYVGYNPSSAVYTGEPLSITMEPTSSSLDEVVVTAFGIKKDRKSLGYALDEVGSEELMKIKTANPLSSLAGKVAGVNITQSSGAAGSGAQIVLRGATSAAEGVDNQPLIVVDGVIYDNSSAVGGNSSFDGSTTASTTSTNRLMDINPEDIENMSILKGPAAAALYGSRAANGVILITTKKGKAGRVEVNLSARYTSSWVKNVPKAQTTYKRGFLQETYNDDKSYKDYYYDDFSYQSWGEKYAAGDQIYDNNIEDFFRTGNIWDTNISVAGGNETGNFYLSGSYYDQDGVVPGTGYKKTTFRFNGEQKWRMFTFTANTAYSENRTDKALTSGGLYGSSGNGALHRIYTYGTTDDMTHYLNEDGTRYRMFGDRLDPWDETDNPYWIINRNNINDKTSRFTGNVSVKADIFDWWWVSFRMGLDKYTTDYTKRIQPGGVVKQEWQDGMMSDNTTRYNYLNTNLLTNFNKTFGDFGFNLLGGLTTDNTTTTSDYRMAYGFLVPDFFSYGNADESHKKFQRNIYRKRLVGVFGEFRADWKSTLFFTVTARNDWTSTLPKENRSYFYPSYSGAVVFTNLLRDFGLMDNNSVLSFGKIRASWAKVGKDTSPYVTNTTLWPVATYLNGMLSLGNNWTRGNPYLKPEMTKSTEIGLELYFFNSRLRVDYAYYTNDSENQILSPRGPQSTGYIFCSFNAGNVRNKGMELSISGTPIQTKDWTWESSINIAGNRGKLEGLLPGMDIMYLTDVQYGTAKAASFSGGDFMAISGSGHKVVDKKDNPYYGQIVLGKDMLPITDTKARQVGNREPKFTGGWNNTLRYKNFTFNMLWEFRKGGDVFNGTQWAMDQWGTSLRSVDWRQQTLTIDGVENLGTENDPIYEERHYVIEPDKVYNQNGTYKLGYNIIKSYYTGAYSGNTINYLTKVNSLRLRTVSLSWDLPQNWLEKTKAFKRAVISATATNLLLFTNYNGDPEAAASGAGVGGSSSVGFDYCGVPSTAGFTFGVNLTF